MKALFFVVDVHNMKPLLSLSLSRDLNLISELVTTNMPASTSTLTCSLSNLRSGSNGNLSPPVEQNISHMKSDCTSRTQDIVSEFADKGLSFEELANKINGAEIYTMLDAASAFHQIQVHPDSQHLSTFGTSIGRFAWARVPYGLRSAPDWHLSIYCQSILTDILCDIPNVLVFLMIF